MLRSQSNTNHRLFYGDAYRGYTVDKRHAPLIEGYLDQVVRVVEGAFSDYSRVFAFRLDLHFPAQGFAANMWTDSAVISRFIESLKAKIRHSRLNARKRNPLAHDTSVRCIWAKEIGLSGHVHYHVAVLLNLDAYNSLGCFEPDRDNMFNRVHSAWASALGMLPEQASGLVHIPKNPMYRLHRDDRQGIDALVFRCSYMCKERTKVFGDGSHWFGSSQR